MTIFSYSFQILILFIFGAVFVNGDDEPFSIGLGVLSPSYTQTVGKENENVKVQFNQKENGGFSYSVGDPSGTNTYLSFGERAAAAAAPSSGAGYAPSAPANAAGYAAPAPSGYTAPSPSGYTAPAPSGYAAPAPSGYSAPTPMGYAAPAAYGGPTHNGLGSTFNSPVGYQGPIPQANFYGNNGYQAAARKPEGSIGDILPAGFSYHATDGQAFLGSMGESPTFMVEDSPESARGPAEQSFFHQGHQQGLVNGLVGFGAGGPRGGLPIGGFAGPQFQGAYREHGGHA